MRYIKDIIYIYIYFDEYSMTRKRERGREGREGRRIFRKGGRGAKGRERGRLQFTIIIMAQTSSAVVWLPTTGFAC